MNLAQSGSTELHAAHVTKHDVNTLMKRDNEHNFHLMTRSTRRSRRRPRLPRASLSLVTVHELKGNVRQHADRRSNQDDHETVEPKVAELELVCR